MKRSGHNSYKIGRIATGKLLTSRGMKGTVIGRNDSKRSSEYSLAVQPKDATKYSRNKNVGVLVHSSKPKYNNPFERKRA